VDREKVGQVMLVPVATSVHDLSSLVQHIPRQVPGYGYIYIYSCEISCFKSSITIKCII
jgi:hypothetical protein